MPEPSTTRDPGPDPLLDLQLQVAHRADELAINYPDRTPLHLLCWLQAEKEILGSLTLSSGKKECSSPSSSPGAGRETSSPARANADSPARPS
ncbi:MAG TPA: hypothetical protein VHN79_06985 [Lacunisphaera sp.]|nr:hypothetical protein [Lacunisphaera sp.]